MLMLIMTMTVSAAGAAVPTTNAATKAAGDTNWFLVTILVVIAAIVVIALIASWAAFRKEARTTGAGTGNSISWLRKRQHTVTILAVTDAVQEGLNGVFQEVRRYHPEIPASDPGEEEIKELCRAFIERLEAHVDYWNKQPPSSTPAP